SGLTGDLTVGRPRGHDRHPGRRAPSATLPLTSPPAPGRAEQDRIEFSASESGTPIWRNSVIASFRPASIGCRRSHSGHTGVQANSLTTIDPGPDPTADRWLV